jgi:hypothetical protein
MVGEDYPADHSAVPSVFGVGLDVCDYEGIVAPSCARSVAQVADLFDPEVGPLA